MLEASVEAAWTLARNATTGYFANDWAGPPMTTASIEAQSSTAMAMNLFAALCGAYAAPPSASYEAEDAVLDHVALEEVNSGFSGWGYVAAWSANNQTVEFTVQVPTATDYRAEFSYAAAGGEAARVLYVRGTMASPRLSIDRRVDELGPCFGDGAPRRRRELDQARLRNGTKQREPAEPRSPDDPPDVKRRSGSDDQNQLVLMPARTSSGAYVDCEPTRWAACDLMDLIVVDVGAQAGENGRIERRVPERSACRERPDRMT